MSVNLGDQRAKCLSNLGRLYEVQGRYGRADRSFHESLSIRRQLASENKDSITAAEDLASSLEELGHLDFLTGLHARAAARTEIPLRSARAWLATIPTSPWCAGVWPRAGTTSDGSRGRLGRADQAREAYRAATSILERLVEENPSSTDDRDELFKARRGLGEIEFNAERLDRAEAEYLAALAALETSSAVPDQTINMQLDRVAVEVRLGEIVRRRRQFDEAIERFSQRHRFRAENPGEGTKTCDGTRLSLRSACRTGAGTKLPGEVRPGDG